MYERFIEKTEEQLLNNDSVELKTKSGGTVLLERISPQGNVVIKHPNGSREYIVSKARLTKLNTAFENLDEVNNIHDEFREVIGGSNSSAYWSVLNAIKQGHKGSKVKTEEKAYSFADKLEVVRKMTRKEFQTSSGKNFVLIIDEINRGNVSQIFGELITLIERDKRLGRDEELKVTLPYSGDRFGVPPNLYIIGTMNTADRSVEALDTALRRRFSFTEMPPVYDLPELDYEYSGVKASDLLKTINRRIEMLLDRDHLIGHSFFIKAKDEDPESKLIQCFYQHLIPLLQEYFYGDYAKIGAILGSGFIRKKEDDNQFHFASGFGNEGDRDRDIYQIEDYRGKQTDQAEKFQNAIRLLMNLPIDRGIDS
nr:AAA family ATPase [Lunatimonas sp.]